MSGYKRFKAICVLLLSALTAFSQDNLLPYELQDNPRFFIKYFENDGYSTLVFQFSKSTGQEEVANPLIYSDHERGVLEVTFRKINPKDYFGPLKRKLGNLYPLEYEVSFPDSEQILVKLITKPFKTFKGAYYFTDHQYRFDLFFEEAHSLYTNNSKDVQKGKSPKLFGILPRSDSYLFYVLKAFPIALVVFLLIGLALIAIKKKDVKGKKLTEIKRTGKNPPEKAQEVDDKKLTFEEMVKRVAKEKNISYDEAALLINLNEGKIDEIAE